MYTRCLVGFSQVPTRRVHKATQTQLLVSRLLPAKTGCGRAVIIHYFIISYDTMNTCTEHTVTSFKSGDAQTAQQIMQDQQ